MTSVRTDPETGRFGPIALNDGVSRLNLFTFFYAAVFTICMLAFISFLQPYLLTENLGMPFEKQGKASGTLTFTGEIIVLLLIAPIGALSDRIGRRPIYAMGFAWIGVGFLLYPLAQSFPQLLLFRAIFAIGTAAVGTMLATVQTDYPQEQSRGKLVGLAGFCNGLGALIAVAFLSKLPNLFSSLGFDTLTAGRFSFWVAAGIALVSALIVAKGLKGGTGAFAHERKDLFKLIREGGKEARHNPRLLVAFMESFVARSDMVVIGTFFSLWAKEEGLNQGLTLEDAMRQAGIFAGIIQGTLLIWCPIWGFVLDRFDRLTVVCMAMAIAALGYLWVGLSDNPIGYGFIPAAILMGMGEGSAVLSGLGLAGQEARARIRGSIMGLFGFCGATGMLIISMVGGIVFDAWGPGAPFLVVVAFHVTIFCVALAVRLRTGYKPPTEAAPTY